jgi:hypothetical protein
LKLDYKEVALDDREWMDRLFAMGERGSLEYSFTTTFLWRHIYQFRIARMDDYLIIQAEPNNPTYLFPAGRGPLEPVIEALAEETRQMGIPLVFNTVLPKDKDWLEKTYPDKFEFTYWRDGADYIYETQSLATLSGKKLAAKRNHIHRFLDNHPSWQYEELTDANMDDARQMNLAWCLQAGCMEDGGLTDEYCAVEQAFRFFNELKLSGGLIRSEGRAVAFSIGDPLNEDTYLVHFEKAYADVQGAYPMINQQFVLHNCMDYTYVNREEDTGAPGLRQAKLSYSPLKLVEKYTATLKEINLKA